MLIRPISSSVLLSPRIEMGSCFSPYQDCEDPMDSWRLWPWDPPGSIRAGSSSTALLHHLRQDRPIPKHQPPHWDRLKLMVAWDGLWLGRVEGQQVAGQGRAVGTWTPALLWLLGQGLAMLGVDMNSWVLGRVKEAPGGLVRNIDARSSTQNPDVIQDS